MRKKKKRLLMPTSYRELLHLSIPDKGVALDKWTSSELTGHNMTPAGQGEEDFVFT